MVQTVHWVGAMEERERMMEYVGYHLWHVNVLIQFDKYYVAPLLMQKTSIHDPFSCNRCQGSYDTKLVLVIIRTHSFRVKVWQISRIFCTFRGSPGLHGWNSAAWLSHESTNQMHVMKLRILHYSLINHHFHQSTIAIKPKFNVNKLVTGFDSAVKH